MQYRIVNTQKDKLYNLQTYC